MEVDPNPQIENSAPTEQCDEPLFQDASVAQVSRLQKKVTELYKKGKDRVQEKDRLLATKQAECEGLVQEINSLRRDKENLKNEVQDLNAQLALLRKEHKKVKKDLQRATERSKKPSLGVNKSKKKILLALQNDMSLVAANSPPDLTSPMETSVSSPTSENTAGLVQLGPIEQIWTKTLDGALEMFFLKSADPNVGLKGCSYPVIDEPTADMTINRIFEVATAYAAAVHVSEHLHLDASTCCWNDCGYTAASRIELEQHLAACHETYTTATIPMRTNFCFQCGVWKYSEMDWALHQLNHTRKPSIIYGPIMIDGILAAPRRCLFCMRQGIFTQIESHVCYLEHIEGHIRIEIERSGSVMCPHHSCKENKMGMREFSLHLQQLHGIDI